MVAIPPTHPPTTTNHAPEQQRSTPHTPRHAHTQPHHRSIRRPHLDTTHTNGGFYYHRHPATACRRRVAALWSQFPPRTHPQPPPRPVQTPTAYDLARTQQPHATPARPSAAPPPRLGHANGGFYYHRRPATACRRRVTPLWSQFPPRAHPQPPTTRPSNNAAPRTPRATPIHNLTTAAFADATSTPSAPMGEPKLRAYPYADPLPSAPCPTATATPPTPTTEPELLASAQPRPRPSHNGLYLQQLSIECRLKKSDRFSLRKLQRTEN